MRPDLDVGCRFVRDVRPPPGRVVLCAVTGSHLYGFPSPDSDLDLKGIHLVPTTQVLGFAKVADTHDVTEVLDGVECDLTTHELGFALRAALKGNGNVLERIASPLQLFETDLLDTLRGLLPELLSTKVHGHYLGFFQRMCRLFDRDAQAKRLLYTARVALTGIHLLRSGEIVVDLPTLAARYGVPEVEPIIDAKRKTERIVLSPETAAPLRRRWPWFEAQLTEALGTTVLPPEPKGREAAEAVLVKARLRDLETD